MLITKDLKQFLLTLSFLFSLLGASQAEKLYWVGGSGNYNDPAHWSLISGGRGGAKTPGLSDDVTFDKNSFRTKSIITIMGNANCHNFEFIGTRNLLILDGTSNERLIISGSINLTRKVDFQFTGDIHFTSSTSTFLNFGTSALKSNVVFDRTGQ